MDVGIVLFVGVDDMRCPVFVLKVVIDHLIPLYVLQWIIIVMLESEFQPPDASARHGSR